MCPSFTFISLHYNKFDQHLFVLAAFVHLTVTFVGGGDKMWIPKKEETAAV